MRTSRAFIAASVVGAAVSVAAASPAGATPAAPTFGRAKAQAQRTINSDLSTLRLFAFVTRADRSVSSADKTALGAQLTSALNALTALRTKVAGETTLSGVESDTATLTGYHIPDFVLPQTALVVQADDLLSAASRSASSEPSLLSLITAAQTAGKDVTKAQAAYNDYLSQVSAATSQAQAAHDSAAGLTVAGAPGNETTLHADAKQLGTSSADLWKAAGDATTLRNSLRSRGRWR